MARKPEGTNFRNWLVRRLAESRWASYRDEPLDKLAERLGVHPSVIVEAQALLDHRMRELARGKVRLGVPKADGSSGKDEKKPRFMIFLEPPQEIFAEWEEVRNTRRLSNSSLLRSVIHHMAQLTWQPEWLVERTRTSWRFHKKWYAQLEIRKHNYRMKTEVNDALYTALTRRALNTGCTAAAICRWGVTSLLEGRLRTLLIVTAPEACFKTPEEYCVSPKIVVKEP